MIKVRFIIVWIFCCRLKLALQDHLGTFYLSSHSSVACFTISSRPQCSISPQAPVQQYLSLARILPATLLSMISLLVIRHVMFVMFQGIVSHSTMKIVFSFKWNCPMQDIMASVDKRVFFCVCTTEYHSHAFVSLSHSGCEINCSLSWQKFNYQ